MGTTIGFVPAPEAAQSCVAWTRLLAAQPDEIPAETTPPEASSVEYLCASPRGGDETVAAVRAALGESDARTTELPVIDSLAAAVKRARSARAELMVASVAGLPREFAVDAARQLLHSAPCRAFVALSGEREPADVRRILAVVTRNTYTGLVFDTARQLARANGGEVTLATIEEDLGPGSEEVGTRELQNFLREASVNKTEQIETRVIVDSHPVRGVLRAFDNHDLVLIGASGLDIVKSLHTALGGAVVGVVKRRPPLRRRSLPDWIPQVNAADYAELAQHLRQGSTWNADFVVMLGLASAIATLGLIQDSAAVVIGSMLLAPLMTPMLGFGLALAQANLRMAKLSGRSIARGFLLTLLVSYGLGFLSFRETLSPEVLSRGGPNILDLWIALFAAVAAAFALARPSISGAVAGVAIATALVPPVCACGVSLATGYWLNAFGASVLFLTNLLAIVVASALTFMLMGVTVPHSFSRARRMARHGMGGLALLLLLISVPLGWTLKAQLDEGRAVPIAFPVTRDLSRALHERVAQDEGVRIMLVGHSNIDKGVGVWLATDHDLSRAYRDELRAIVREKIGNPELQVWVVALRSAMDK